MARQLTASSKAGMTLWSPSLKRKKSFSSPVNAPPLGCTTPSKTQAGKRGGSAGPPHGAAHSSTRASRAHDIPIQLLHFHGARHSGPHFVAGLKGAPIVANGNSGPIHDAGVALLRCRPRPHFQIDVLQPRLALHIVAVPAGRRQEGKGR